MDRIKRDVSLLMSCLSLERRHTESESSGRWLNFMDIQTLKQKKWQQGFSGICLAFYI